MSINKNKILRLILGDQLNANHSWFKTQNDSVTYVLMEIRTETDYVQHHIQKVIGFFAAMQNFALELQNAKHQVIYIKLNDKANLQSFDRNCEALITKHKFTQFEYQLPDEFRVDEQLKNFTKKLAIPYTIVDSEHFCRKKNVPHGIVLSPYAKEA
jgi:deoxyribodipyrimidine photolyase-related protein